VNASDAIDTFIQSLLYQVLSTCLEPSILCVESAKATSINTVWNQHPELSALHKDWKNCSPGISHILTGMVCEESRYQLPALQLHTAGSQLPMAIFLHILGFKMLPFPKFTALGIAEVICLFQYHLTALSEKLVIVRTCL